ncbi:MAG: glycoside hydrolase family 2, partial [Clostridia bacterium]|nr:glycoside hydrolase family 2 [Clostridia bacterium]
TIFNEGWGQFTADKMYELLKSKDETRIIDATSGWFWQKKSDVYSHHIYFKKLNPKNPPDRPSVISEFGGYSLRIDGHLFGDKNYGYSTLHSSEELEDRLTSLYLDEVLPLAKSGTSAFVYTQVSDVEDETNGFMTYDREVLKVDADKIRGVMEKVYKAFEEGVEK